MRGLGECSAVGRAGRAFIGKRAEKSLTVYVASTRLEVGAAEVIERGV